MTPGDAVDYRELTQRQQATWATGDFNEIARQVMGASATLVDAVDPRAGQRVLDVACGSGNAALVAARRYCEVAGIDYVPALVDRAKQRAAAEGSHIDFQVGDAQELPFPDASFDAVISVFGVMFAPDQEKAARELLRVCRPGGTIGLACWMPTEFGGDFFAAHARYVPPPPGLQPPVRWGTEAGLRELLGAGTRSLRTERRSFLQYYRSTDHMIDIFRKFFGPMNRAFSLVEASRHDDMRRDFTEVLQRYNRADDDTLVLESAYMQTVAVRA
jgi:SAM-dependent methyltransferase